MRFNSIIVLGIVLATGIAGCITQHKNIAAQDTPTFRPQARPEAMVETRPSFEESREEASGEMTLKKAVALALRHNPELKSFSWAVRAREAGTLQSSLRPNPEFGINIENVAGSGAFSGADQAETTIALSQVIELDAKRKARTQVATMQQDLSAWDQEIKRMEVLTRVSKAFTAVLSAQEGLNLIEDLLDIGRQVVETVSARVKAGKASPVEEIKVKVALASTQIKVERAKRALKISRKNLAATWGDAKARFERVLGQLASVSELPSQDKLLRGLAQNPELARWAVEISSRQAVIAVEKSKAIPNLTLSGGLRSLSGPDDNVFVVGLSFPLSLMNRNQGGILEARYELAEVEEKRRAAEIRMNTALADAYNTLATAHDALTALQLKVLPGAQGTFDAVNAGYRLGKFSLIDVLDAQRTISDAKVQHLEALTDYHLAIADLERLIGGSISPEPIGADLDITNELKGGMQ